MSDATISYTCPHEDCQADIEIDVNYDWYPPDPEVGIRYGYADVTRPEPPKICPVGDEAYTVEEFEASIKLIDRACEETEKRLAETDVPEPEPDDPDDHWDRGEVPRNYNPYGGQ